MTKISDIIFCSGVIKFFCTIFLTMTKISDIIFQYNLFAFAVLVTDNIHAWYPSARCFDFFKDRTETERRPNEERTETERRHNRESRKDGSRESFIGKTGKYFVRSAV